MMKEDTIRFVIDIFVLVSVLSVIAQYITNDVELKGNYPENISEILGSFYGLISCWFSFSPLIFIILSAHFEMRLVRAVKYMTTL